VKGEAAEAGGAEEQVGEAGAPAPKGKGKEAGAQVAAEAEQPVEEGAVEAPKGKGKGKAPPPPRFTILNPTYQQ
jgi:hypothetical protein